MKTPRTIYRRLPGRSFGLFQAASLWIASDHLLLVNVVPGGEYYRRFFFRDIEAVVIRPTGRLIPINVVLLVLAAINLLPLFVLFAPDAEVRLVALIALGSLLWSGLAVVNALRGRTCDTRIQTAVQFERITALSRLRTARHVIGLIRPQILAAQTASAASAPVT